MSTTDPALLKMCLHKRIYETRAAAKQMARLTGRGVGQRRHRCQPYRCTNCGFWHVTSNIRRAQYPQADNDAPEL
jgi:lipopolysaccharide biosynthesis regulator YciM